MAFLLYCSFRLRACHATSAVGSWLKRSAVIGNTDNPVGQHMVVVAEKRPSGVELASGAVR